MARKYLAKNFNIEDAVEDTINHGKVDQHDLADLLGIGRNSLYKMCYEGSSGNGFISQLQRAVQLMSFTKNYSILYTLARLTGHIVIKEPRGTLNKKQKENIFTDFNLQYAELLKLLIKFLHNPSREQIERLIHKLTDHIEHTAKVRRRVQVDQGQYDLFENN